MNAIYIDGFSLIGGLTDIKVDLQTSTPMLDENNNVVGEERALAQRSTLSMRMAKELAEKLTEMVVPRIVRCQISGFCRGSLRTHSINSKKCRSQEGYWENF